jgi:hypothetical protein
MGDVMNRLQKTGYHSNLEEAVAMRKWPTPTARDHKDTGDIDYQKIASKHRLSGVVMITEQEAPTTGRPDQTLPSNGGSPHAWYSNTELALWPTPNTSFTGRVVPEGSDLSHRTVIKPNGKKCQLGLYNAVAEIHRAEAKDLRLNPRWVEALMGLPIGWTMPTCKQVAIPVSMRVD